MSILGSAQILNDVLWDGSNNESLVSVTVPDGTNLIVVLVGGESRPNYTCHLDGVAFTKDLVQYDGNTDMMNLFSLQSPTIGAGNIQVRCDVERKARGVIYFLSETSVRGTAVGNSYSASASVTVATESGDTVLSACHATETGQPTAGGGQTADMTATLYNTQNYFAASSSTAATTSTDHTYTISPSRRWVEIAVAAYGSAAPSYTITSIDGDNDVQAGQTNVDIIMTATTGVTSVTLGGEALTINGVT